MKKEWTSAIGVAVYFAASEAWVGGISFLAGGAVGGYLGYQSGGALGGLLGFFGGGVSGSISGNAARPAAPALAKGEIGGITEIGSYLGKGLQAKFAGIKNFIESVISPETPDTFDACSTINCNSARVGK